MEVDSTTAQLTKELECIAGWPLRPICRCLFGIPCSWNMAFQRAWTAWVICLMHLHDEGLLAGQESWNQGSWPLHLRFRWICQAPVCLNHHNETQQKAQSPKQFPPQSSRAQEPLFWFHPLCLLCRPAHPIVLLGAKSSQLRSQLAVHSPVFNSPRVLRVSQSSPIELKSLSASQVGHGQLAQITTKELQHSFSQLFQYGLDVFIRISCSHIAQSYGLVLHDCAKHVGQPDIRYHVSPAIVGSMSIPTSQDVSDLCWISSHLASVFMWQQHEIYWALQKEECFLPWCCFPPQINRMRSPKSDSNVEITHKKWENRIRNTDTTDTTSTIVM